MALLIERILIADEYSTVFDQVDAIVSPLKSDILALRIFLSYFFLGSLVNLNSEKFSSKLGIRKVHVEFVKVRLALTPVIHVSFLQTSHDNTTTIIVKSIVLNTVEVKALSLDILCPAFNSLSFNTIIDEPFNIKYYTIEIAPNNKLTQNHRPNYFVYEKVNNICPQYKPLNKTNEVYRTKMIIDIKPNKNYTVHPKPAYFIGDTMEQFQQSIEALGKAIIPSLITLKEFSHGVTFGHQLIKTGYVAGIILSLIPLPSRFGDLKIIAGAQIFDLHLLVHVSRAQLHGNPLTTPVLISIDPEYYCYKLQIETTVMNIDATNVLVLNFNKGILNTYNFSVEYRSSRSSILETLYAYRFYAKECDHFNISLFALQLIKSKIDKFQLENMDDVVSVVLGEVCFLARQYKIFTKLFEFSHMTKEMQTFTVYDHMQGWISLTFALQKSVTYIEENFVNCEERKNDFTIISVFVFFSQQGDPVRAMTKCATNKETNARLRGKLKRLECDKIDQKHARRDHDHEQKASLEVVQDFNEGKYNLPVALMSFMSNQASLTILLNKTRNQIRFGTVYIEQTTSETIIVTAESLSSEPPNLYYDATLNYLIESDYELCQQNSVTYLNFISSDMGDQHAIVHQDHSLRSIKCGNHVTINTGIYIRAKIIFGSSMNSTSEKCQVLNQRSVHVQNNDDNILSEKWCNLALSDILSSFLVFVQTRIANSELIALITNRKLKATPLVLSKTLVHLITNSSSTKHQKMRHFFDLIMHMIPDPIRDAGQSITLYYIAFNILYRFSMSTAEREQSLYSVVIPNLLVKGAGLDTSLTHYFTVLNAGKFRLDPMPHVDIENAIDNYNPMFFVNISREMDEMLAAAKVAKRSKTIKHLDDNFLAHQGVQILNSTYAFAAYIYPTMKENTFNKNNTFEASVFVNNTYGLMPYLEFIDNDLLTCLDVKRKNNPLLREPDFSGWEDWPHNAHSFAELVLDMNISNKFAEKIEKVHTMFTCANSVSLLKHPYLMHAPKVKCGPMGTAFFDLRDGQDIVKAFHTEINIFLIDNGFKIFEGGACDDLFIFTGDNIQGILDGGAGKDTLDLSLFAPECLIIKLTSTRMEYCGRAVNVRQIERFIFRDNQQDILIAGCTTQTVKTGNGSSYNTIRFPEKTCRYNVKLIVRGSIFVENNALIGDFVYDMKESAKNCIFVLKRTSTWVSQRFVLNSMLCETRISLNEAKKFVLIEKQPTLIKIHINDLTYFNITFTDCSIQFKYPNFIGEWERFMVFDSMYEKQYYLNLLLKRISLIVMSKAEKTVHILPYKSAVKVKSKYTSEVLALMPHKTYETVIHLPLSNSLVVLNHKTTFETIDDAILPDVTIKMSEAASVFDHTLVIKYYVVTLYRTLHISPKMTFEMTNNGSLVITLNTETSSGETIKLVKLQLIPENLCQLTNFRIAKNALLKFEINDTCTLTDYNFSISLTPVQLFFSSSTNFVVISADDIEENATITIDHNFIEIHVLKYTSHLLMTNFKRSIDDIRAIVLWSFATRKIFRTLTINFNDRIVSLNDFADNKVVDTMHFHHMDNTRWLSPFCKSENGGNFVEFCD